MEKPILRFGAVVKIALEADVLGGGENLEEVELGGQVALEARRRFAVVIAIDCIDNVGAGEKGAVRGVRSGGRVALLGDNGVESLDDERRIHVCRR